MDALLQRYAAACDYPGVLDEAAVERALAEYLRAIKAMQTGVQRIRGATDVINARPGRSVARDAAWLAWNSEFAIRTCCTHANRLAKDTRGASVAQIADDGAVAEAARKAWHELDGRWDLSAFSIPYICAPNSPEIAKWARPVFDAFCAGAWLVFWGDDVLYWVAKPTLHTEMGSFGRRLHCETGPALISDRYHLYFIHGVRVPESVVMSPITLDQIKRERNSEVSRILIERYGWVRYLDDIGAVAQHQRHNERDAQDEAMYLMSSDGSRRFVVTDPSTGRRYALGVPREVKTCQDAQNWITHGLDARAVHRS